MTSGSVWSTSMAGPPSWVDPSTLTRQVWDAETAKSIPGVGRALGIYGMVAQCALLHEKNIPGVVGGSEPLGIPRFLQRPDPDVALPTFIGVHVEDWFLHGNACHKVTARDAEGKPAAVRWYPAHAWGIQTDRNDQPIYTLHGKEVPRDDVVHVRRGQDPTFTWRGVGVVEQFLATLNRAGLQSAAESANLTTRGMPSVVVIKPNAEADPDGDDEVATKWVERFGGQTPKPGIFPKGTEVHPLSWNPTDQQLVQARGMTLKDIANAANLDGYWLGAEGSSHTYRSPQPMFLTLLRTSLGTMLRTFEDEWSFSWLPYGRNVRFDRLELLRDDLQTMVNTFARGRDTGLFPDVNEPRLYMGFRALDPSELPQVPPALDPDNQDDPAPDEPPQEPPADPAEEDPKP